MKSTIETLVGEEALVLLSNEHFQTQWDNLYELCPWTTVFQSKKFVMTWYNVYKKQYLPIIVKATNGEQLSGLLLLAKSKRSIITAAGANRAEYQVWLTSESDGEWFIKKTFSEVKKHFPNCDMILKFIPAKAPLEWVKTDSLWKNRCILRAFNHPLWILENERITKSLRKQSNKINRLKKAGELTFEIIRNIEKFRSVIDEVIVQFDFRKGAMYNTTPFQEDPLRKELLLELFKENFLHVSILKLNENIIACKVATKGDGCIILQGMSSHAPSFANHSPGILHFLMLGKLLSEEGYTMLDLTPGEDLYKQQLATVNQQAYELFFTGNVKSLFTIFSRKIYFDSIIKNKKYIYDALASVGIKKKTLKHNLRRIQIVKENFQWGRKGSFGSFITSLIHNDQTKARYKIYSVVKKDSIQHSISIKKDSLKDLIKYKYGESKLLRGEFLTNAMEKFENGEHVYTLTEDSCLLNCVWIKEQVNEFEFRSTRKKIIFPNGSTILFDIYCHPNGIHKLKDFLISVTNIISANSSQNIYLISTNKLLQPTFECETFIVRSDHTEVDSF